MVVAAPLKAKKFVRIAGGYGGRYDGRAAKILQVERRDGAVKVTLEGEELWFERRYVTPITETEARMAPLIEPESDDGSLGEIEQLLNPDSEARDWRVGDRVTPKHRPGSRIGTIVGLNRGNKRTPLLVQFDGEKTTGKWGWDAVIAADNSAADNNDLAIIEKPPESITTDTAEIIDAEIVPSRADLFAQCEARLEIAIAQCKEAEAQIWIEAYTIRSQELWREGGFRNFEQYCKDRWGWERSNAHEVASAGEVLLQLKQSEASDLPTSLAAIRPLKKLEPDQRLKAIEQAIADFGKLTAHSIKQAIELTTPHTVRLSAVRLSAHVEAHVEAPSPTPHTPDYGYTPIEPKQCWHAPNGTTWVEGQAVARNERGGYRVLYGEDQESFIPERFLQWEQPEIEQTDPVPEPVPQAPAWQSTLLHQLKDLAAVKSAEIYAQLCQIKPDAELSFLVEVADEIEGAIAEILELHFLAPRREAPHSGEAE